MTDLDSIELNTPPDDDLNVFGVSGTISWELPLFTLKSITAYRKQEQFSGQDYDGTPTQFLDQHIDGEQDQFSQEFQILGTSFDDALTWVGGVYYFTETGRFDSTVSLQTTPIQIFTGNKTKSWAAFGQATYHLTDRLNVTGGLRWTKEKKFIESLTEFGPFTLVPRTAMDDTFEAWSPKFAVDFKVTDRVLLYGSVTRGFRSGGFNGRPFAPADLTAFGPETTTSYETGIKTEFFDRRVRLNLAAFYNDYKDIQVTATTTNAAGQFVVVTGNAGKATVKGLELELQTRPTSNFELFGSVGYSENSLRENPGFSFGARELPNAPKWSVSGGGQYTVPIGDTGDLVFGADASYRSRSLPQFNPAPESAVGDYTLINARVSFAPVDDRWRVTLYGKNLTDKLYRSYAQTAGTGDVTVAWFGRPREYGLSLEYRF